MQVRKDALQISQQVPHFSSNHIIIIIIIIISIRISIRISISISIGIMNHKNLKVMARINSKLVPVTNATADLGVVWLDNDFYELQDAMGNFMFELG